MRKNRCLIIAVSLPALLALPAIAQSVPGMINYQGRLTDNSPQQNPVTATVPMQFAIYDAVSGGTSLWREPAGVATLPVAVNGGIFNVLLGSNGVAVPAAVFNGGAQRWLEITAGGEILAPRQVIAATGYANQAQYSASASSATVAITASNALALGGVIPSGYQLATSQSCGAGQFLNAIGNGTASCAASPANNLTPPVTLSYNGAAPIMTLTSTGAGNALEISSAGATALRVNQTDTNHVGVFGYTGTGYAYVSNSGVAGYSDAGSGVSGGTQSGNAIYGSSYGTGAGVYGQSAGGPAGEFVINNAANNSAVLITQTSGAGAAISATSLNAGDILQGANSLGVKFRVDGAGDVTAVKFTGDGSGLTNLPGASVVPPLTLTGSISMPGNLLSVTNTGTGMAGIFSISNPASPNDALVASTSGNGAALHTYSTGPGVGAYLYANGNGSAALVVNDNTVATSPALYVGNTSTAPTIRADNNNGVGDIFQGWNGNIQPVFRVDGNGNVTAGKIIGAAVGLGTSAPIAQLHVAGRLTVAGTSPTALNGADSIAVQGRYAYVANSLAGSLAVFDVSNPAAPAALASTTAGLSYPNTVQVLGRYAYVASKNNNALVIFDISNPSAPVLAGSSTAGLNTPYSVYVQGRYAYVASYGNNALVVFDVASPAAPVLVGSTTAGLNGPASVSVQGRYAYVASYSNGSLVIFDIANPAAPVNTGSSSPGGLGGPIFVDVQGRYAYVVNYGAVPLAIYDVANPAAPALAGSTAAGLNNPRSVQVRGRFAYIANNGADALAVYDVSNPASPAAVVSVSAAASRPNAVFVQGRYAFAAGDALVSYDLGGAYLQDLEAGVTETGALSVAGDAQFNGDAQVKGGLAVGSGGLYSAGDVAAKRFSGDGSGLTNLPGGSLAPPLTLSVTSASPLLSATNGGTGAGVMGVNGSGVAGTEGVYGYASGVGTYGAWGDNTSGAGVYGKSQTGSGVVAENSSGASPAATVKNSGSGPILIGTNGAGEVFRVDNGGNVTANGRLTIGVYTQVCAPTTATFNCACNGSDPVIGGGAYAHFGQFLRESRPGNGPTYWTVSCETAAGADIACWGAYAICLSHGT